MSTPHALIIDDNPTNIDVLAMLLEQQGVAHTALTSSQETLESIGRLPRPDIIFLDLDLGNDDYY
jgi:CheY-like chemotaxis protein